MDNLREDLFIDGNVKKLSVDGKEGMGYLSPYDSIWECGSLPNAMSKGVYLLAGKNAEGKTTIFIKSAANVYNNITNNKSEWEQAVILVSDKHLQQDAVTFIEKKLSDAVIADCVKLSPAIAKAPVLPNADMPRVSGLVSTYKAIVKACGIYAFEAAPPAPVEAPAETPAETPAAE
jgi:hypothetical protein